MRTIARGLYRFLLGAWARACTPEELRRPALVFAPHPDDETLGCGGTIMRKRAEGARVRIVLMTDGSNAFPGLVPREELTPRRYRELRAAAGDLGVSEEDVLFLGFEDGRLGEQERAAGERVADLLAAERPAEVFVPHHRDGPADHLATTRIVLAAARRALPAVTVYEYPVWLWYHWPMVRGWGTRLDKLRLAREGFRLMRRGLRELRCKVPVGDLRVRKRLALDRHHSQMKQLVPDPAWKTLPDVAGGDWLACFFRKYEFFYRYDLTGA